MHTLPHTSGIVRATILTAMIATGAFAQSGIINVFAGSQSQGAGYSGDGGPAISAQISGPTGLAVDSAGNVYIADSANLVIRMVSTSGVISTIAGNGIQGYVDGFTNIASFAGPQGIAVDSSGSVYVADGPNHVVRKISGGTVYTIAGTGRTPGYSGDGASATSATLNFPTAVAVDSSGNVYIADSGNHRIRKVSGGVITTIAGTTSLGYNGDNIPAATAQLYVPQGVAVDPLGNIYIADTGNNRIRMISGGTITTIAGTGTAGYSGDKGPGTLAQVSGPVSLAADPNGNVYVADTGNSAIRRIANGIITTVAGTGAAGYSGDGSAAINALLRVPGGVAVDPTGGFTYISDTGNNEIRVITNAIVSGVIPHFGAGASYITAFYVINKSSQANQFTLSFYSDTGALEAVPVNGGAAVPNITGTVPPLGTSYFEVGNISAAALTTGSVTITSTSSIVVQGVLRRLSGINANIYYEGSLASTNGAFEIETAFDATTFAPTGAQIYTGVGIANIDPARSTTVTCTAKDNTGTVIPNAVPVLNLPPQGHGAGYLFPALAGKRGTLDCVSSTTKIGLVAFSFIGSEAFTALPVLTIR